MVATPKVVAISLIGLVSFFDRMVTSFIYMDISLDLIFKDFSDPNERS